MHIAAKFAAVALSLCSAGGASAAVYVFDVNGVLNNSATFTGTVSIDTADGVLNPVKALNVTGTAGLRQFSGFNVSTILSAQKLNGFDYFQIEGGGSGYLKLVLHTGTLAGYAGGGLCPEFQTAPLNCGFSTFAVASNGGFAPLSSGGISLQSPLAAVPEAATWATMVVGFGLVGGAARSRRRSQKIASA